MPSYTNYSKERLEAALRVNNKFFEQQYKKLVDWYDEYEDLIDTQNQLMDEYEYKTSEGELDNFMDRLPQGRYSKESSTRGLV